MGVRRQALGPSQARSNELVISFLLPCWVSFSLLPYGRPGLPFSATEPRVAHEGPRKTKGPRRPHESPAKGRDGRDGRDGP